MEVLINMWVIIGSLVLKCLNIWVNIGIINRFKINMVIVSVISIKVG